MTAPCELVATWKYPTITKITGFCGVIMAKVRITYNLECVKRGACPDVGTGPNDYCAHGPGIDKELTVRVPLEDIMVDDSRDCFLCVSACAVDRYWEMPLCVKRCASGDKVVDCPGWPEDQIDPKKVGAAFQKHFADGPGVHTNCPCLPGDDCGWKCPIPCDGGCIGTPPSAGTAALQHWERTYWEVEKMVRAGFDAQCKRRLSN